jgi:hypothetical protein
MSMARMMPSTEAGKPARATHIDTADDRRFPDGRAVETGT